jgi:hypothetical protein
MRNHICFAFGSARFSDDSESWISTAQRTASTTLENSAMTASPQVFTCRPSWRAKSSAIIER